MSKRHHVPIHIEHHVTSMQTSKTVARCKIAASMQNTTMTVCHELCGRGDDRCGWRNGADRFMALTPMMPRDEILKDRPPSRDAVPFGAGFGLRISGREMLCAAESE